MGLCFAQAIFFGLLRNRITALKSFFEPLAYWVYCSRHRKMTSPCPPVARDAQRGEIQVSIRDFSSNRCCVLFRLVKSVYYAGPLTESREII